MGQLSKQDFLKGDELQKEKVVFDDGSYVFVREMTAHERSMWEQSMYTKTKGPKGREDFHSNLEDYQAKLAVCTICAENGELIFDFSDYKELAKKTSAARLNKIVDVAYKLSGITEEDREEMTKNSEGGQSDNSISNSAAN